MKDNPELRLRVLAALACLVGAKFLNVQVPFLFKLAIDSLSSPSSSSSSIATTNPYLLAAFATPSSVLIGYGIARSGSSAFNELRTAIFSKVSLRTIRSLSRKVLSHLHDLDLRYHLNRETGALNRVIDRGSRAINTILSAMVFNVVPTILEISMVSGILTYNYGAVFGLITCLSVGSYIAFTLVVTQYRTKFRKAMNKADNDAGTRAVDSLINYETVKYFNNESYEARNWYVQHMGHNFGSLLAWQVLFNDTIYHNIHYGNLSATEEEVYDAARRASIHDTIMNFPEKYKTAVGERGLMLSGGEKQRVALARAFLKSPAILLCDEATSALDNKTEAEIMKTLRSLASNRTCVFIAHRLTTAMQCDEIIVMEKGKVVEKGTHEELLKKSGRYADLWIQQNSTVEG
ncbi:hypothetical protein F2Q69_00033315 [Brassica cretica]|uniref:ABC transmembrane type-1 domain-containing protein n=1 Tax=Brassica cretica TaxID=69181 RepID=A0A8S9SE85_BRACR|nr:hypothetical protein F2Q69_00033315 [Brassica cretica]